MKGKLICVKALIAYCYKGGKRSMDMFEKFPVAHLDSDQLQKILTLETELRNETNENIVLIAYDEKGEE